jgi:PAS domain S-box-containing protein
MSDPLRILHLEDNAMDAELVAAALADEGLACQIVRTATRSAFAGACNEGTYDIILSDYSLPGFNGIAALAIAREVQPDVPFVFVSGTMGEEVAIDCLKQGATDYVLKHRLSRLGPAVRRALQDRRHREARATAEAEVHRLNAALGVALGHANAFLDSIVENLPDLVSVKDARDLRYVRFNRATDVLLGVERHELLGKTAAELFPAIAAERSEASDRAALESRAVVEIPEEIVPTRDRGPRVFHTKKIPILDETGAPAYLLSLSRDVTERRLAEENARLSKLEAERANLAKSEFLSRMSHDLRTPLNAVLGFAQLLDLDGLPTDQADSVRQILGGGRHLLDLINEILDITRIESGQLSLSLEPVAAGDILHHVANLLRPLARARNITIVFDEAGCRDCWVRADRQRLTQILLNFASNAVKYNRDAGSVILAAAPERDGVTRLSVTDTGAGIPAEKVALLFQPFERLGAEQSAVEGTGLGLAVAKGLAEAMGGSVGVTTTVDRGSTFWLDLPETEAPVSAAERMAPPPEPDTGVEPEGTVLYIEDNASNVRLLERLLGRRRRIRLVTESRGALGIERAIALQPDLVLLDLHLPDLPGEEVLQRLWADPRTRGLRVAVLSADAMPAQRQRLLASGAIAYLTKPVDVRQLLQLIDERLNPGSLPESAHD